MARGETSVAVIIKSGRCLAIAIASAPLPVPISISLEFWGALAMASSAISSVSTLGLKTLLSTKKSRP